MDERAFLFKGIARLLLVVALLVGVVFASTAGSGASPVAHEAKKKCKKHKPAYAAKKKCKKKKPVVTQPAPSTPAAPPPSLAISPTDKDFGDVIDNSANETFTVTNTGAGPTGTVHIALGGTDPGNFVISSDTCDGATLGGGASCTLDVHCTLSGLFGAKSATLNATSNPGGYPYATLTCNTTT